MVADLKGVKRVEYVKKDTGENKKGIELHLTRKTYPAEPFVASSLCVFTEYISFTSETAALCNRILGMKLPCTVDLVYVQNGRYANLVDVTPVA